MPRLYKVQIATEKLEMYKLPGIDQIPSELIKAGSKILCSEIHNIINSMWNKEEPLIKLIVVIIKEYHFYELYTKFYPKFFFQD
jgi:hypothetical protein